MLIDVFCFDVIVIAGSRRAFRLLVVFGRPTEELQLVHPYHGDNIDATNLNRSNHITFNQR